MSRLALNFNGPFPESRSRFAPTMQSICCASTAEFPSPKNLSCTPIIASVHLAGDSARFSNRLFCCLFEPACLYYTPCIMKHDKLLKEASSIAEPYCITKGGKFRLKDYD